MSDDFEDLSKSKQKRTKRRKRNYDLKRFHEERDGLFRPKVIESKKRSKKKLNKNLIEELYNDV